MWPNISRFALSAVFATIALARPCAAQDIVPDIAYLGGYAAPHEQSGYGADLIDGSYIGAPLTRVPSPRAIVPTPWSYGTYGVPTVSGIRNAPVGEPVVYVIEGSGPSRRRDARATSRMITRDGDGRWSGLAAGTGVRTGGGARVVQVSVPRR